MHLASQTTPHGGSSFLHTTPVCSSHKMGEEAEKLRGKLPQAQLRQSNETLVMQRAV